MAENYIQFYGNIDVKYIKSDKDITKTFKQAIDSVNLPIDANVILITLFDRGLIDGNYLYSANVDKSSIFSFYRRTPNQNYYQYICTTKSGQPSMSDYNIVSNENYHYLIAIERNYLKEATNEIEPEYTLYESTDDSGNDNYYHTKFIGWSICNIKESDSEGIYYKTGNSWNLGLNLGEEVLTQNLSVTTWNTLSQYPKISMGNRNYESMSFSGYLGRVMEYDDYRFSGLTNQYSTTPVTVYQYTEKDFTNTYNSSSTCQGNNWTIEDAYSREIDKLNAWRKFINDGELKLIRDAKGNGWIGMISDSAEHTISQNTNVQQTTISFQWKEVMDRSTISIIGEQEDETE